MEQAVEDQWHYPIFTKYGFTPLTLTASGAVRAYKYQHPSGVIMIGASSISSDYWSDETNGSLGYRSILESHLKSLGFQITGCEKSAQSHI